MAIDHLGKPFGKNSPTAPLLKTTSESGDIEAQKKEWIRKLEKYNEFNDSGFVHPFFGKMNSYHNINKFPEVTFSAFPDIKVIHPECTNISWYGIEYYDNDSLFVFGFGGGLIGDCETLPDIQFFQAHHGIFNTTSSPISYTISGSDELQLIITDQLGTQAFYTDTQLKVSGNTSVTIA